jgi:glycosyltransferase involved in cell wall biosynthesis
MSRTAALRVLVASRLFPPEPGAAAYRLGALARTLAGRGVQVDVLTTRPPAHSGHGTDPDGVRVSRWPVLRDAGGNVRGYVQFLSFDGPLLWRLLTAHRPGVVVVEPPPTTGTVVRLGCALRRIPYVYYAGDVSSTAARGIGVAAPIVALLTRVEAWAMSGAAAVLAVSPGVAEEVKRLTEGRVDVAVVGTGVDTDVFAPKGGGHGTLSPTLVYAGTMSEIQGAEVFVEAFAAIADEFPTARLVMCGQGSDADRLRRRAEALARGRIEFRGMLSGAQVADVLSTAWVGLASLHPGVGYDYAFPTKMFASTACGTPVIYAGPGPGRAMVTEHDLGWACDWDPDQVAAQMRSALTSAPATAERRRLRQWTLSHASQSFVAGLAADRVQAVSDDRGARGGRVPRGRGARA